MTRRFVAVALALVMATAAAGTVDADGRHRPPPGPGAPGVGDPYFPLDGNGGYDVDSYDLDIRYDPATDVLEGVATIRARATQGLTSFDLDLVGLTVRSVEVNSTPATFRRDGDELVVVPRRPLADRSAFRVVVRYDGVPVPIGDPMLGGLSGFIHTDDGTLVAGQPDVAATWFPVNDHPSDAASYRFDITVPAGLEAVANGILASTQTRRGWTTWSWVAREPMASYLATATIGEFELDAYRADGIRYWDAIDPDLFAEPITPHSGAQLLASQAADRSYKRLTRTLAVPPGGATLTFWVARSTEPDWDHFFVEARTPGASDWTTLPEATGITSTSTGNVCPWWLGIHPFLTSYQTPVDEGSCDPTGTTGEWNAVSGVDTAWTQWTIDLGDYAAAGAVEVSLAYASDDIVQLDGVALDDIVVSTGEGSTSFEDDGDPLDGWTVSGPPAGSPGNEDDWTTAARIDVLSQGDIAAAAFARQPEIIGFLSDAFGRYPFSAAGGIVDDLEGLGFALENQTRPIYARDWFSSAQSAEGVIVHELAHQWFGDDVRLAAWQDIWLNEGFATYAEWLWEEHEGRLSVQETFDLYTGLIPDDDPFWQVVIGDPGPELLFDGAVYTRGAMTLQALRVAVGDRDFFRILRQWAARESGEAVTTPEFIHLAERISGDDLDELFATWLYTPAKPELTSTAARVATAAPAVPLARLLPARHR